MLLFVDLVWSRCLPLKEANIYLTGKETKFRMERFPQVYTSNE